MPSDEWRLTDKERIAKLESEVRNLKERRLEAQATINTLTEDLEGLKTWRTDLTARIQNSAKWMAIMSGAIAGAISLAEHFFFK